MSARFSSGHLACHAPVLTPCAPAFPAAKLRKAGIFSRVDDSNTSIGKRYARNDELGTPYGLTLDFACTFARRHQASNLFAHRTNAPTIAPLQPSKRAR